MNYFGKLDAKVLDALGQHPSAHLYSETVHADHVPADAVVVPDAQLLFNGEFKRTGVDLVLSGDGREVVLHDYFKGEHRAAIASPDGAHLTGDLVTALAGEVQVAQADGNTDVHKVIGHVTKLVGTATAMRNGVSIILNNGDNVEKGDVVSSGTDSTLGITFIDGTVFGLSANARMVLNEMVYDPNGSNNSSLLSLVAGTITFVAGETAKHGDMKVDTPVATMGIRGTAVLVEIDFSVPGATPDAKFQVLVEPDGTTGSYILFDKTTLTPLAVVDRAGTQINISNGIMSQTLAPLSPEIQKLINDVFTLKFTDNTNTKSLDHFTDSIVPTDGFGLFKFAGLNNNAPTIPVIVNLVVAESNGSNNGISTKNHIPEAPSFQSGPVVAAITEQPNQTGIKSADVISGQIQYFDVNTTDHDTLSVNFSSFTYLNAKSQDVTNSLTSLQLKDIAKVEATIGVVEPLTPDTIGNATATWTYSVADTKFDFLAKGETLTLTYTATVDNNYQPLDQASSQTFTITITGTNDVPKITTSQENINFGPAGTGTSGGTLNTATSGTMTFTDPDLTDTHTVSASLASALLNGVSINGTVVGPDRFAAFEAALTAQITAANDSTGSGTGTITWQLADLEVYLADLVPKGETLVLTYAITVTDSHLATSNTQDVVITIGGNQPPATVWKDTDPISTNNEALWSTASNWESDLTPTNQNDVFIGTDQVFPSTPTFPVTVNADAQAKSLTMDYFTDFGAANPTLDIELGVTLAIAGALKLDTSTDPSSPLIAESIIRNWGTISVGDIAELLRDSVLDNYGTFSLAKGGEFADQSSITNSGTIEIASDTLALMVDIVNSAITPPSPGSDAVAADGATAGTIQVDTGARLLIEDGGGIIGGNLKIASGSIVEVTYGQGGSALANGGILDGVHVTNAGTIQVDGAVAADPTTTPATLATLAATLLLDGGTAIIGGKLTTAGGSTVEITYGQDGTASANGATLDGVQVTNDGTIQIDGAVAADETATPPVHATPAATLLLDGGTAIIGGKLTTASGSTVEITYGQDGTASANSATLDGVHVTNDGTIQVDGAVAADPTTTPAIHATPAATLTLDDGTIITHGDLTIAGGSTLDVEAGTTDPGATLDGVTVTGTNGIESAKASIIEVGASGPATFLLDDGTTITNGNLTIDSGSAVDVESVNGATLDGVAVGGTSGGTPSTIAVGGSSVTTLVLDGGTTITNGNLNIAGGSTLDVEAGTNGHGATLDGVTVNGTDADAESSVPASVIDVGISGAATLLLDDGTTITGGDLTIASGSTVDVESVNGATLDGVTVSGTNDPSTIEIGNSGAATLLLDDGTTITKGNLTIAGGSALDIGTAPNGPAATLDGVAVSGTNGDSASLIEIGTLGAATLLLDDGTTITNGNLNIVGGSTLDVESGKTGPGATLDGVAVHGTDAIDKIAASTIEVGNSGAATLLLDGGTTITNGNLTIAGGSTLDVETAGGATLNGVAVANAGTIQVDGDVPDSATVTLVLDGGTKITGGKLLIHDPLSSGEGVVEIETGGATFDDVTVTNNNELIIDSLVTLALTDSTSILGGTIDDKGTLSVNSASEIGNATVDGGGNLTATAAALTLSKVTLDDVALAGSFTNADTLTIDDIVTLNGATISGGTIDDTGTLSVTAASEIENATIDGGGDLTATAAALTLSKVTLDDVTLAGSFTNDDTLTIDDIVTLNGATISGGTIDDTGTINGYGAISSVITGSGGLTATGGTLTLTGVDTYAGTTTISGTLVLSGTGSIADSSDVVDDGTFDISGLTASGTSIVTLSGTGIVDLGGKTLTLSDASTAFSGAIDGSGGLTLTTGTETLSGNNLYTGTTTINGGSLKLSGSGLIAHSSGVVDNGTLDISGTTSGASIVTLSGTGTVDLGTHTLTLSDASTTFAGAIDGSGGLTLTTGTETLSGDNLYSGATTINGGTLKLSNTGSIAHSSGVVDNGTLDISGTTSGASIVTLSGTGTVDLGTHTLTLSDASTTFAGAIDGSGGLTLTTGTETLSGDNLYSGATTINGGSLKLSNTGSIAHSSDVVDDGTFDISGTTSGASIVTLSGTGTVDLGTQTLTLTDASTTFDGTISSTGGDITVSAGTLTLGTMTLDDVTLAGSFDNSGTLTIDSTVTLHNGTIDGGTIDIVGVLDTTGTSEISGASLINSDHIDVVSGTFNVDPTPFTNTGTFEVQGSAVFSGEVVTNTHGVAVQIDQEVITNTNGIIQIDQGGTLTLFDTTINGGTIDDNGTLLFTGTTSKLDNVTFTGTATLDVSSHTTLEIGGSVSSGVTVDFTVANGDSGLILDNPYDFHGVVEGLVEAPRGSTEADENYIDLTGFTDTFQTKVVSAVFNSATDVTAVTIANGTSQNNLTIDLHGDYSKGDIEFASDHHGGTLFSDPAADSGVVTIDSGTTLDIGGASSATITFTNSTGNTGELVLGDSHDFTGTIAGFVGDGTTANSDLIDATDINFANVAANETTYTENANGTGTLTLHDTTGQALDSINFMGNYQLANFTIENDGNGGTLIVDPPVNSPAPANTIVASAANQTLIGSVPSENFVFNFANVGHATIANFDPTADTVQFSGSVFANVQSILNAVHDDGHGNSVIAIDAHDSITLHGVAKAQLHAGDFHIV